MRNTDSLLEVKTELSSSLVRNFCDDNVSSTFQIRVKDTRVVWRVAVGHLLDIMVPFASS